MLRKKSYKIPLVLAVLLHVFVLLFLFLHFIPHTRTSGSQVNIVNATVINSGVTKIHNTERKPELKLAQSPKPQPKPLPVTQPVVEKSNTESAEKRLAMKQEIAAQAAAQEKLAEEKAQMEKKRMEKERIHKELAAKKKAAAAALAKRKAIEKQAAQIKAAQQQMMAQQLAQEQQQLATSARDQQVQSEIDKYRALIVQAISQNWVVPGNANKDLSCQLLINVGPGGAVLNVSVVTSSGNSGLDQSAVTAVYKTSPLPVPSDPDLFDKFRVLRLTVKPQNIVSD